MKKTSIVVGCLVVLGSVVYFKSFGGAADRPSAGTEALLAREAVAKVLAGHSFTPPLVLAGPPGSVWYFSSRPVTANLVEQAVVGVRGGNNFTVELSAFHRQGEQTPWAEFAKTSESAIAKAELSIREQLQKQLAGEETAEKPGKPKKEETTK